MRLIKRFTKSELCDRCARLCSKVGKEYKCHNGHQYTYFRHAPSYCAYFKPRKGDTDAAD